MKDKFITLTLSNNKKPIYINISQIDHFTDLDEITIITINNKTFDVVENSQRIMFLITSITTR